MGLCLGAGMTSMAGSTKRSLTIRLGGVTDDRIRAICSAKNMTQQDVILELIMIGLNASQDLELAPVKPKSES